LDAQRGLSEAKADCDNKLAEAKEAQKRAEDISLMAEKAKQEAYTAKTLAEEKAAKDSSDAKDAMAAADAKMVAAEKAIAIAKAAQESADEKLDAAKKAKVYVQEKTNDLEECRKAANDEKTNNESSGVLLPQNTDSTASNNEAGRLEAIDENPRASSVAQKSQKASAVNGGNIQNSKSALETISKSSNDVAKSENQPNYETAKSTNNQPNYETAKSTKNEPFSKPENSAENKSPIDRLNSGESDALKDLTEDILTSSHAALTLTVQLMLFAILQ
jgi:hypothetical protein